jgi:hypothetical protein
MNTQDKDFDYFLENMENFYTIYGHKFITIKNLNILGAYNTFNEALETTLKTEEMGAFIIQECFDDKEKMVHHFHGNVMPVSA